MCCINYDVINVEVLSVLSLCCLAAKAVSLPFSHSWPLRVYSNMQRSVWSLTHSETKQQSLHDWHTNFLSVNKNIHTWNKNPLVDYCWNWMDFSLMRQAGCYANGTRHHQKNQKYLQTGNIWWNQANIWSLHIYILI